MYMYMFMYLYKCCIFCECFAVCEPRLGLRSGSLNATDLICLQSP